MKVIKKTNEIDKMKVLKDLVAKVEAHGLKVRREKLTRGFGYNVAPGVCRLDSEKLVFVNTHSRIEEQIVFLEELLMSLSDKGLVVKDLAA